MSLSTFGNSGGVEGFTISRFPEGSIQLSDGVHELYRPSRSKPNMVIILLHGLNWEDNPTLQLHLDTWRTNCGQKLLWPRDWLSKVYRRAHILSLSYDGCLKKTAEQGLIDMHLLAESMLGDLVLLGIGEDRPVIFVGHGSGGLLVSQICILAHEFLHRRPCQYRRKKYLNLLRNVRGIFYFSTPFAGLHLPNTMDRWSESANLLECLQICNAQLARLNPRFNSLPYEWVRAGVYETLPTKLGNFSLRIVDEASATSAPGCFVPLHEDHISITRPRNERSSSYLQLVRFIGEVMALGRRTEVQAEVFMRRLPERWELSHRPQEGTRMQFAAGETRSIVLDTFHNQKPEAQTSGVASVVEGFSRLKASSTTLNGTRNELREGLRKTRRPGFTLSRALRTSFCNLSTEALASIAFQ